MLRKYTNSISDLLKIIEEIVTCLKQYILIMKDFFNAIQDLFVNFLFPPLDALRVLELTNWFAANAISWIFLIIGFTAFVYWMKKLKGYNDNNEEDKSISAHSYL